jgi:signal transduction histidine kinase
METSKRVLVIDDEGSIREAVSEMLRAEGFEVYSASDGVAGAELAKEHLPDLILCDVMMPRMDGYGMLTVLRKDPLTAAIPFIFLTGKADPEHLRVGMNLGADDYLIKPFTRRDLIRSITTRFEKRSTQNQRLDERLDHLRTTIARTVPHEMMTPLNIIIGFSEMIAEEYDHIGKTELLGMAQKIYSSARRLQRLMQNFLLHAELETCGTDPEKVKALLAGEVHAPRALLEEIGREKAAFWKREADLDLNITNAAIEISEVSLRKIAEELVDNAFKFSGAGTPVCVMAGPDGPRFGITVKDYGRGMTPQQVQEASAFEQFERKIYEQQGAGLGLAIARRLVQLNGGEFKIETEPGHGTTIRLFLRLVPGR